MADFIPKLRLNDVIRRAGVDAENAGFEAAYSDLYERDPDAPIVKEIEARVQSYFAGLELPDCPTLYDHLLLSLRRKDVIATFNWDPFLADAYDRWHARAPLPQLVYLHGNVRVGICLEDRVQERVDRTCPVCGKALQPSRLLYPVKRKDYSSDPFIRGEWKAFEYFLENAFALTIFGYGAPKTDADAVAAMEKAWRRNGERQFETTELIDIRPETELRSTWRRFIYSQHYLVVEDFYRSYIARHPRRSCEALYEPTVMGRWVEDTELPLAAGFEALEEWFAPLIQAEEGLC